MLLNKRKVILLINERKVILLVEKRHFEQREGGYGEEKSYTFMQYPRS